MSVFCFLKERGYTVSVQEENYDNIWICTFVFSLGKEREQLRHNACSSLEFESMDSSVCLPVTLRIGII